MRRQGEERLTQTCSASVGTRLADSEAHPPMKNDHDPRLRQVLQFWQVTPPAAPNFKANVWRRIAAAEARAARTFGERLRDWFLFELPKPAYATALLLITALIGTTAASIRAEKAQEEYRLDSARQYLASINPLSMAAQMQHPSR